MAAPASTDITTIRLPFKKDDFGNDIFAKICWSPQASQSARPIALVYHAGGLVSGSTEIVPVAQITRLCAEGFIAVLPNYRLVPQVSGRDSFIDCVAAFNWTLETLPAMLLDSHRIYLDVKAVVGLGHSSGGSMCLHLAALGKPLRAITSLYPSLYVSDPSTDPKRPATGPFFDERPDNVITQEDWQEIKPKGIQLSETSMPGVGTPNARSRWLINILRNGQWLDTLQPDGDFAAIDPMTRIPVDASSMPPVFFIHGSEDNMPGRSVQLIERAATELKDKGCKEVEVVIVPGAGHLFDHMPGTSEEGERAVQEGLDWLVDHSK